MELSVVGGPEFTLGFRISGIRNIHDVEDGAKAASAIKSLMQDERIGIIITDDRTLNSIDERTREDAERCVKPVTVVVSTDPSAQDALRKMILKSIGVDLWKS